MWHSPFKVLPVDGSTVWIRVTSIYGDICLATYDDSNQTFTTVVTSLIIPAFNVARWKAQ